MKPQISAMTDWTNRYIRTKEEVAQACAASGRRPGDVLLLAVSKFQPAEAITAVAQAGQRDFGENYIQEWESKQEQFRTLLPDNPLRWHMTGHLQHRKAPMAAGAFALIHTLDSRKLADALEKHLVARNLLQPVLLEINIGGEMQKPGAAPGEALELASHVLENCPHLLLRGLMCIPPLEFSGPEARPFFARLRQLRDRLERETGAALPELSMGMSSDFAEAIAEGATIVRIGTSIFGPRPPRNSV